MLQSVKFLFSVIYIGILLWLLAKGNIESIRKFHGPAVPSKGVHIRIILQTINFIWMLSSPIFSSCCFNHSCCQTQPTSKYLIHYTVSLNLHSDIIIIAIIFLCEFLVFISRNFLQQISSRYISKSIKQ